MRVFLRQSFFFAIAFAGWWTLVDWLSFRSGIDAERIDTLPADIAGRNDGYDGDVKQPEVHSLYKSQWESILASQYLLARTHKPKMIIIGGSTTMQNLRPAELAPLFPDYEIHNLSFDYGTLSEIEGVAEMAITVIPPTVMKKSLFVLGIYFNVFRGGNDWTVSTLIAKHQQMMYPHLFRTHHGRSRALLSDRMMLWVTRGMRPFYFARYVMKKTFQIDEPLFDLLSAEECQKLWISLWNESIPAPNAPLDTLLPPPEMRVKFVEQIKKSNWIHSYDMRIHPAQFSLFTRICQKLRRHGARIVFVEMPMTSVQRNEIPESREFLERKTTYFSSLCEETQAQYFDFGDLLPDSAFLNDWAHLRYGMRPVVAYHFWANYSSTVHAILQEKPQSPLSNAP